MDTIATNTAGLRSSRGIRLFGRAAYALAVLAIAFGFAAWIADFNPVAAMRDPAPATIASTLSFEDRFGSGPALKPPSIRYTPRLVVLSLRLDFATEFDRIEEQLAGGSRDAATERQSEPSAPSAAAAIPMPRSRPVEANLQLKNDPPPAPVDNRTADNRTLLQKLADLMPPAKFTLASLTPGDGLFSEKPDLGALGYDNQTAVYDISARVVYMPNGAKLEAHSGLGSLMDDLGHVNERNAGATPPNVYDLKPREKLFHGVPALRMTPVGENDTFGRAGLLVHSYMLGPNGDSNGCVSIKDYGKFLAAFRNGEVKRLVVVPSLGEALSASRRSTSPS
jgi:hypothetical protein